jgi:putative transposase
MSRPLRIQFPGACYHVMNRGRRREKVVESKKDCRAFLTLLEKPVKEIANNTLNIMS